MTEALFLPFANILPLVLPFSSQLYAIPQVRLYLS